MHKAILIATVASSLLFLTSAGFGAGSSSDTNNSGVSVAVQPLENGFCRAQAPAGWTIIKEDDRGAIYSVASPDRGMIATYGVIGVNGNQEAGYQGPQYRRPALFAQYLAETAAGEPIGVTGSYPFFDMQGIDFESDTKRGFVMYRTFPLPDGGYVIAARVAIGESMDDIPVVGAVAASIDCNMGGPAMD